MDRRRPDHKAVIALPHPWRLHEPTTLSRRTTLKLALQGGLAHTLLTPGLAACAGLTTPSFRPEDYGARGDGRSDDLPALRRLFAAASAASGDIVLGTGKTYLLNWRARPIDDVLLSLSRGIRIVGNDTTIRIAPGSSGYVAIIGNVSARIDLTGLSIEGVTFDHGGVQAAGPAPVGNRFGAGVLDHNRGCIYVLHCRQFSFTDNRVKNSFCTNTIFYSGAGTTSNCSIVRNEFTGIGRHPARSYHDHSTLYVTGDDIDIRDNVFEATEWGSEGGVCAIEVHPGSRCLITGNRISAYHTGINFAGVHETESADSAILGNNITALRRGVAIYSGVYADHRSGTGISRLRVDGNDIKVRLGEGRGRMSGGGPGAFGIGLVAGATLPVRDVDIGSDNRIVFEAETAASDWDSLPFGAGIAETGGDTLYERVQIGHLLIVNAPVFGLVLGSGGGRLKDCSVRATRIVNAGSTVRPDSALGSSTYRSALLINPQAIEGTLTVAGLEIAGGEAAPRLQHAVTIASKTDSRRAQVAIDFKLAPGSIAPSAAPVVLHESSKVVPLILGRQPTRFVPPASPVAPGSRMLAADGSFIWTAGGWQQIGA